MCDVRAAEHRARRVADLYVELQNLTRSTEAARAAYDAELITARREHVSYAVLGDALLVATGTTRTAENLARVEWVLRSATRTALRRRSAVKGDPADHVDDRRGQPQDKVMSKQRPILIREHYFDPNYLPPDLVAHGSDEDEEELGDAEDDDRDAQLGGDERDDQLDGDEELDGDSEER